MAMAKAVRTVAMVLLAGCLLAGGGCRKKAPAPTISTAGDPLSMVVATWQTGGQEPATRQFLAIDWKAYPVGANSIFALREDQLPQWSNWQAVAAAAQEYSDPIRELSRDVLEQADQAAKAGDREKAAAYVRGVQGCGDFLASDGRLAILQALGQALQRVAEAKRSELGLGG